MRKPWLLIATLTFLVSWTLSAVAQSANDVVWVQIEAHPSLATAQERAQAFGTRLEDVNGFALGGGWYGIALGPYRRIDAEQVLRVYRSEGEIPRDSYIALSSDFRQQFYPAGADILNNGTLADLPETAAPTPATPETATTDTATAEPEPTPQPADETPAEARRAEQALDRDARRALQVALKSAGFYNSTVDGLFGRGTRNSMAAWQEANGFEVTGILTTLQRQELFRQYNAVLDGLGLQVVRDDAAGIEMKIPTEVVAFSRHDYPFSQYDATGDIPAQVLLISQAGDRNTLYGLYDIMQTLEIVPLEGDRERGRDSFTLVGQNAKMISYTEARLQNGEIKGFTLVWPTGDEERRTRMLDEMRSSFTRLSGVLDPSWSDSAQQAVDLVSGLKIRKPKLTRSGFFVNTNGTVVTATEAVAGCARITIDEETEASIAAQDDATGITVLTPTTALAPRAVARFSGTAPRLNSDVAVSGFSYGGVLEVATLTFGQLSDLRGLRGEEDLTRLALDSFEGDVGGPVFDETGGVLGVLLPRAGSDRQLPADVQFAADARVVQSLLSQSGIASQTGDAGRVMAPEDITAQARDMTVLVSCWED
ncbi:peptidoglycan-binding protein [Aliishimia ponticola]|uniref:Peptidoglycan-binding protein n=1 Tax=Aliishimia ponticola TaxID=2499833 RepID=A0A4S4NGU8_9RHOB|nr:serine protease [Aliishimia ponticola]THH37398.1 peptidoglycan-binding protein [Aliishimia ponticola]